MQDHLLKDLTIITITYNNTPDVISTTESLRELINHGCNHIIMNGGEPLSKSLFPFSSIFNERDQGPYEGMNNGLKKIKTDYFMLLHSGDTFIGNINKFITLFISMKKNNYDLVLNDQIIEFEGFSRKHSSKYWRTFMFNFGTQPPHLPILYRRNFVLYDTYITKDCIIADFDYLKKIFSRKPNFYKGNMVIIKMKGGGRTSSGFQSLLRVSEEFIKLYGLKGVFYAIFRIPFKILQLI